MRITIQGEGAEDFAEAFAYHLTVVQVPIAEIVINGESFEFEPGAGVTQPMCKSQVPVTIEVLS
jgi:hypothetical protein